MKRVLIGLGFIVLGAALFFCGIDLAVNYRDQGLLGIVSLALGAVILIQ